MIQKEHLFSKRDIVLVARYIVKNPEYISKAGSEIVYPDDVLRYVNDSQLSQASDILNPSKEFLFENNYSELAYMRYEQKFSKKDIARILYNLLAHFTNDAGQAANLRLDQIVYRLNTQDLDYLTSDTITQSKIIEDSINWNLSNLFLLFAVKKGLINKDNISNLFSSSWYTPILNWAIYVGLNIEIFEFLLCADAPFNSMNIYGNSMAPLHLASYKGLFDHVRLLTMKGANVNAQDAEHGDTPMLKAVINNHLNIIDHLARKEAEVDRTNNSGSTPLCWAASNGLTSAAAILIAAGADVNFSDGRPLKSAVHRGKEGLARLLIKNGARVSQTHIDQIRYDDNGTLRAFLTTTYNEQQRAQSTQISIPSEVTGKMLSMAATQQVGDKALVHGK